MANIFIIGATGGIGRRLCPILQQHNHHITALNRQPERIESLKSQGVTPVSGDIIDISVEKLSDLMEDQDIVVFSAGAAGSGLDRTTAIDGEGPAKVMTAMKQAGISRFYLVSAFPEAGRDQDPKPGFEHYMKMKKKADADVAASDLDWLIVRPGTLLHEDGDDRISAGLALPYGSVKRGNVAALIAELVETPEINREIIEVTDGNMSVSTAVKDLIRH